MKHGLARVIQTGVGSRRGLFLDCYNLPAIAAALLYADQPGLNANAVNLSKTLTAKLYKSSQVRAISNKLGLGFTELGV